MFGPINATKFYVETVRNGQAAPLPQRKLYYAALKVI